MNVKAISRNVVPVLTMGLLFLGVASLAEAKAKAVSVEVSEALKAVNVQSKLLGKLGTDALRITPHVSGTTVTLTGEVEKATSRKLAESVALSVHGVKKVDNQLTQNPRPDALSNAEATVKDAMLLTKVKTILLTDIGTDALKIDVDVADGVVSLRGTLPNAKVADEAMRKTRSIKGVKKVINLLA
jgi:hyperosmotically inducible periplasmic protein